MYYTNLIAFSGLTPIRLGASPLYNALGPPSVATIFL